MAALWKRAARAAAEWLYPRGANCLCCGDPRRADEGDCLCEKCREGLRRMRVPASACERCLSPVRKGEGCRFCKSPQMKPIERVYSPYRYGEEARALIRAFKFQACGEALPLLADAMADALKNRDFDCLTPVPLHPRRLRRRGYDQALLLCRALSQRTGIPVRPLLSRDRYHRPQSLTPMKKRGENVKGAFSCKESADGLRVLLVDDVRTSGHTACACAESLLSAGARSVSLCTAALVYRRPS